MCRSLRFNTARLSGREVTTSSKQISFWEELPKQEIPKCITGLLFYGDKSVLILGPHANQVKNKYNSDWHMDYANRVKNQCSSSDWCTEESSNWPEPSDLDNRESTSRDSLRSSCRERWQIVVRPFRACSSLNIFCRTTQQRMSTFSSRFPINPLSVYLVTVGEAFLGRDSADVPARPPTPWQGESPLNRNQSQVMLTPVA